ncbi:hypothetical protein D4100_19265 [Serratia inhibens]|uniref:Uncharacterized protein n=1 Tax=Serratia inhibens TaxID=2338073 RepID=A0AA92X1J3_9GAMM|nr:hypothetical protein D4100_19265 [Serratia inhibens]
MILYHPGKLLLFFAKLLNRFFRKKDRELNGGWQSSLLTRFSYCDRVRKFAPQQKTVSLAHRYRA